MSNVPTSTAAIASQMVAGMNVVEPTLDLSVGTTMRKLIDIHAEADAQVYANYQVSQYANAITTLTGSALDSFCAQFGMARFAAKYATGSVTFTQSVSVSSVQNQPVTIPVGTQVATQGSSPVFFQTLVTFTMSPIDTSVAIPIQAVVPGSGGNVGANTIITTSTPLNGVSAVINPAPTSGGTDAESDQAFIARFLSTVFRALTGTSQMFLGTALENPAVTAANTIGAYVTHSEQIEISSGGTAISSVDDAAFVYPYNIFMATNLSAASSVSNEGSFVLGTSLTFGVAVTHVVSMTAVTLPAGTMLAIGSGVAVVSASVTSATTIPVQSFTPSSSFLAGEYTVSYLYNTGSFLTNGVDFSLSTATPLVANPSSGPVLTAAATTMAGEGFMVSETLYYRFAYGNGYGQTVASAETSVAVTGTSGAPVQVTVTPALPAGSAADGITQVLIYRGTASNGEVLAQVIPASKTFWIDFNTVTPSGAYPTTNTTGVSVTVTSLNNVTVVPGALYQLRFNYIPLASRNSFALGILNRVDVYTAGSSPTAASEAVLFMIDSPHTTSTLPIFSGNPASTYFVGNFQRTDGTYPQVGNALVALSYSPIISVPTTIISPQSPGNDGAVTKVYETDYWAVNNVTSAGWSDTSIAGIEWNISSAFGANFLTIAPASVSIPYVFNAVPAAVDTALQQWRLLSQDVMVHQATAIPLNFYLVAILSPGISLSTAQAAMSAAIQSLLSSISFNGYLEPSVVIAAVSAVTGVQAVRFANSSDVTGGSHAYAIAPVDATGAVLTPYSSTYPGSSTEVVSAVTFSDTTYPIFNGLFVTPTAQNLFGPG
jgi:uncharacterized phage protein gp47/JayE